MGINITGYSNDTSVVAQTETPTVSEQNKKTTNTVVSSNAAQSEVTVSSLAQQLSAAAMRAQVRDSSESRKQLGETARQLEAQIVGDGYWANKKQNDAEVPNTSDPDELARAQQATAFINGSGTNPFKGMSRDQLDLIAYDGSGTFTVNERRAAWQEAYDQEEAWRVQVIAQGELEYQSTGKQTNFFSAVLKHYQGLPLIEQVQYPDNYASQLQDWIDLDFNFKTERAEGHAHSYQNLMESLLAEGPYAKSAADVS